MSVIEVQGLKKSYGDTEILKGIDLSVEKGNVVAILGSSGSGKTTLLRCMNFMEKADSGILRFGDKEFILEQMKKKRYCTD